MPKDLTEKDRLRSDFEVESRDDFTKGIVSILTSVMGRSESGFDKGTITALTDIVTLLRRVVSNMTGTGPQASATGYVTGGLLASGGIAVKRVDDDTTENVFGSGNITQTVSEQIAQHAGANRYKNTSVGKIDTFDGMSEELVRGMYGKIVAERGLRTGDVMGAELGTTTKSIDTQMRWMEDSGVTEKNDGYIELNKTRAVRAKMDEMAQRMYDTDDYNQLDKDKKAAVKRALSKGVDADGDKIDVGNYQGRKGQVFQAKDISDVDIEKAERTAEHGSFATVVTDSAMSDIDEIAQNSAKNLQAWSDMLGTKDIEQLQGVATRLKLQSVTSKKGTEQLADTMKDVRTFAELAGKSTGEVLQGYSAIASSLDAAGAAYSYAEVADLYAKSEQFAREDSSGQNNTLYSASKRTEMARQQQINQQNNMGGILAARHILETGEGTADQIARAQKIVEEYDKAIAEGRIEDADELNWGEARDLADEAGIDLEDQDVVKRLSELHMTKDDLANNEEATLTYMSRARADEVVAEDDRLEGKEEEVASMLKDAARNVGVQGYGAVANALRETTGMDEDETISYIENNKNLTDDQKRLALGHLADFGNDDEGKQLFADTLARGMQDKQFQRFTATIKSGAQLEAEQQRRAQVEKNIEDGVYKGDKGTLQTFSDALVYGQTMTGREGKEAMEKTKELLQSKKTEDNVEGLLQLKNKDGSNFIEGKDEEERRKNAQKMVDKNKEGFESIVRDQLGAPPEQVEEKGVWDTIKGWFTSDSKDNKEESKSEGGDTPSLAKLESLLGTLCTDMKTIVSRMK